ncbi:coiled-coil domain-containing protein 117 [Neosynchiropus ocellatus]
MYSFSSHTSLAEFDLGPPKATQHLQRTSLSNNSWEARCLRKHRRRNVDEGCLAKKRRLMVETEALHASTGNDNNTSLKRTAENTCPALSAQSISLTTPQSGSLPNVASRPETDSSCMEIEAAQRKLREIESRITLEDDDDDEDLDVEPAPRRPVLVISDSLKEGLQRGIGDILPHTVAQSVSHSCMELVLWRPPEDPFCRKLKGSLQKQRKQQVVFRQTPTPCSSSTPHNPVDQTAPPAHPQPPLYSFPVAHHSGEEDMEM